MMVAVLGIALPEIRQSFSLSETQAGSLFSVMMTIAGLTSGMAGHLADKIGRKTVLIAGLTLLSAGFAAAGLSQNWLVFFFCLGVTGIGYGFTPPSLYALMSDLLPRRRGLGASLISVTYGIGGAIGAILSSWLVARFGWRAALLSAGSIAALDMLLQIYWIGGARSTRPAPRGGSFRAALTSSVLILAAAEFIGGSVFWSCAAWTPTALRGSKALTLQETGWIMATLSLANMLGSFGLGYLSDKLGRRNVILLSAFPAALAAFVVFYWLDSAIAIALGIFVFGLLKASVPALVVALAQEAAPPGNAGSAAGIIMSLHYFSGVLAPLIAAPIITAAGDILTAMVLVSAVPLTLYGGLIAAVRFGARQ